MADTTLMRAWFVECIRAIWTHWDFGAVPEPSDDSGALRAAFAIEGVDFLLAHDRDQPHVLSADCAFGPLEGAGEAALHRLLEINLSLAPGNQGVFGADAKGELVFHFKASLRDGAADELITSLRACASQAVAWREGRFTNAPAPHESAPVTALLA